MHRRLLHLLLPLLCVGAAAPQEQDSEVVLPLLLSGQDAHLSALRRRGQRSLDVPGGGHRDPGQLILSVPAFGRSLYLNLTQDSSFLTRGFVVEQRLSSQPAAHSRLPSSTLLCFYSGNIINITDSAAALSTCGGLTGLIQIGEKRLFIQPLDQYDLSRSFSGLKHRLQRQRRFADSNPAPESDQHKYCGTVQGQLRGDRKCGEHKRGRTCTKWISRPRFEPTMSVMRTVASIHGVHALPTELYSPHDVMFKSAINSVRTL